MRFVKHLPEEFYMKEIDLVKFLLKQGYIITKDKSEDEFLHIRMNYVDHEGNSIEKLVVYIDRETGYWRYYDINYHIKYLFDTVLYNRGSIIEFVVYHLSDLIEKEEDASIFARCVLNDYIEHPCNIAKEYFQMEV